MELMSKTFTLAGVLAAAFFGWIVLAVLAQNVTPEDYDQAMKWAKELLGLGSTLAGFLGVSAAAMHWGEDLAEARATYTAAGFGGVLAGATLLEVGGWPIPAALAAIVVGSVTVRVIKAARE